MLTRDRDDPEPPARMLLVPAVGTKYLCDFLRDLLLRRTADEAYVTEHADLLGWDLRHPMIVVSAELDPPGEPVSGEQRGTRQKRSAVLGRRR